MAIIIYYSGLSLILLFGFLYSFIVIILNDLFDHLEWPFSFLDFFNKVFNKKKFVFISNYSRGRIEQSGMVQKISN